MAENEDTFLNRGAGFAKKVFSCLLLKKKMQWNEESKLRPSLHFKDTLLITIVVVLRSFYEEMPRIISSYGYMIIFPLLLSGMMSFITTICLAEMVCLNPNTGGTYRYVYYTMGELMAFLVGWSIFYTSFLEMVQTTSIITKTIDGSIFNGQMANFTSMNLPIGGFENYFLRILPNVQLENIFIFMTIAGPFIFGFSNSVIIVNVISLFNILIICSCITIFWFYMDLSNFKILGATEDFSFFTKGSVEGHLFYMDFEVTTFAGAESFNPTVNIPMGLVEGFHVGFLIYMASIILYSAREGATEENAADPVMKNALKNLGFKKFCMLPPIGLVLCHYVSGKAAVYEGSRVMYTMAKDGLIFPIFSYVHPHLKNPIYAHIFMGIICCIVSLFVGIAPSTKWSIHAMETIVRIMSLVAYLLTRYQCESDDLSSEEQVTQKKRWVLANLPHALKTPTKTTHSISMLLIFLSVITIALAEFIMTFYIIEKNNQQIFLRLGFVISSLISFTSVHLLNQQPVNDRRHFRFKVRGVPFTPILAITWYILILMFLPHFIWIKLFSWWIIGLLFYFSYACLRSKEYKNTKQKDNNGTEESMFSRFWRRIKK